MSDKDISAADIVIRKLIGTLIELDIAPAYRVKRSKPEVGKFRLMSIDEIKRLSRGEWVWCMMADDSAIRMRVNGEVKRWKRRPDEVEVPLKYGLKDCMRWNTMQATEWLLVRLD